MPAWNATKTWTGSDLSDYRQFVTVSAPKYKGMRQDCADLSMSLLIDFAESRQLPVTFRNDDGWVYSSKEDGATPVQKDFSPMFTQADNQASWTNKSQFTDAVWKHINVRDLWKYNTVGTQVSKWIPNPGDLLMIYEKGWVLVHRHHCALVYQIYPPGQHHPKENDWRIPNYPGGTTAMKETSVLEYFRGDTLFGTEGNPTMSRSPDSAWHFDYLNSRGDDKRHAELIYFANATDFGSYGFEFRIYNGDVLK